LDIIEKRINEKLTVENIAADIYISKFHYMRLFREIVGDSVMDYVIKRKLTLAAKSLLETSASILDIALDYGYDSRDGFSRSFKAFMGVTPAEYRKRGLIPNIITSGKEYRSMDFTKTTDAVIREINEWIFRANDLAKEIRHINSQNSNVFWNGVADQTEVLADGFLEILEKVNTIARKPDEISDGMDIVKAIDDTAFVAHSIAFQIELMEARTKEEYEGISFAGKYRELAWFCVEKAEKITVFFRELLLLVVEDMRKTAGKKIKAAIEKGKAATESVPENLLYIKEEITQLVDELSVMPVESVTTLLLDDSFFKVKLIAITAKLNSDKSGDALFDNMRDFSDVLYDAAGFCATIVKPVEDPPPEKKNIKIMQDIVFMENILLFYAKGELDHLIKIFDKKMDRERTAALRKIKNKISDYIKSALKLEREENAVSEFQEIADRLYEIVADFDRETELLGTQGGAIKIIADEHRKLADKTNQLINEIKGL